MNSLGGCIMKIKQPIQTDEAQVQIVPLIDVIFCILTFFILAALQFSRQEVVKSINLELPRGNTGTESPQNPQTGSQPARQTLLVQIDGLGQVFVENQGQQAIPKDQLRAVLENYLKQNPTGILVLNAARSASYNDVIVTLDLLRQVGGDRVSLGIIPGGADQPASSPIPGVPGTGTLPNNPQGGLNPTNLPPATNQVPFPNIPAPGVNPANSGQLNIPVQTAPVAPASTKSTP
jgi:biopolymer transport protein ExbD